MLVPETGADVVALQEVEGQHVLDPLLQKLSEMGSNLRYSWCNETLDPYTVHNRLYNIFYE